MTYVPDPADRRPIAAPLRATADAAVGWCVRHRVSPNAISVGSAVASLAGAALIWAGGRRPWLLLVAPFLLYLRLWFNMLDGMVALAGHTASSVGELFNEMPDRASDVAVFVAVAASGLASPAAGYWAALMAVMTAYVRAVGRGMGGGQQFGGVMSKPWRMVLVHAGCWTALLMHVLGRGTTARLGGLTTLDWTCWLVVAGCAQTVLVRLRRVVAAVRHNAGQ